MILRLLILSFYFLLSNTSSAQNELVIKEISRFTINTAITPETLDYLTKNFNKLPPDALILIELNTPGGLVSTTKDILTLMGSSKNPIAIWVTPEGAAATSAGAIMSSAAHFIFMNTATNIGAATPITMQGDLKESDGKQKAMNDLTATVKSMAITRGKNPTPFVEMIEKASTFTHEDALKKKIIDAIMTDINQLKTLINQKKILIGGVEHTLVVDQAVVTKDYERNFAQNFLSVIAHPTTAYILFLMGLALIYWEFQAPGGLILGAFGVILLLISALSFQVLPLNWVALLLLLAGIVLLVVEIFVTSFGVLTLAGLLSLGLGSLFLFDSDDAFLAINYQVVFSTLLGIIVCAGGLSYFLWREHKNFKDVKDFFIPVGDVGVVMNVPNEQNIYYQVKAQGSIWRAASKDLLQLGDKVTVVGESDQNTILQVSKLS